MRGGSIYVEFDGVMEPIDDWYAGFDEWVIAVAPANQDRFIEAPTVHDFIDTTEYLNPYFEGCRYELSWDAIPIAEGYQIEYVETVLQTDDRIETYYEVMEKNLLQMLQRRQKSQSASGLHY